VSESDGIRFVLLIYDYSHGWMVHIIVNITASRSGGITPAISDSLRVSLMSVSITEQISPRYKSLPLLCHSVSSSNRTQSDAIDIRRSALSQCKAVKVTAAATVNFTRLSLSL
jgi:hypothetical protein